MLGAVAFDSQLRLRFEVQRQGRAAAGWGLVWTHGLVSSVRSETDGGWPYGGVAGLCDQLPVMRYDARGHGTSDDATECTWRHLGGDLVLLRRALGRQRKAVLGGTSMGAAASLYAAIEAPHHISGLILANPPTCYEQRRKFIPMYKESVRLAKQKGLEEAKRLAARKTPPPIFTESDRGRACFEVGWRTKLEMGVDRYCTALEGAIASDLPPLDQLKEVKVPTLILAWKTDAQHPVESAELLKETLPNAELHVASTWSDVETFPEHMRDFLRRVMRK